MPMLHDDRCDWGLPCRQASSLLCTLHVVQRASRSLAYGQKGIQIPSSPHLRWHLFSKTWQKVISYHLPWVASVTHLRIHAFESGARLPCHSRFCWTTAEWTVQVQWWSTRPNHWCSLQHPRLSLRWSGVNARETVHVIAADVSQELTLHRHLLPLCTVWK